VFCRLYSPNFRCHVHNILVLFPRAISSVLAVHDILASMTTSRGRTDPTLWPTHIWAVPISMHKYGFFNSLCGFGSIIVNTPSVRHSSTSYTLSPSAWFFLPNSTILLIFHKQSPKKACAIIFSLQSAELGPQSDLFSRFHFDPFEDDILLDTYKAKPTSDDEIFAMN